MRAHTSQAAGNLVFRIKVGRKLYCSEALGSFGGVLAALPTPRTKRLGKKCWLQRASPGHLKCWQRHPLLK